MRRETAYKLAGRKHDNGAHHAASGVAKTREIRFKDFPPGQAAQAWRSLAALRGVQVEAGRDELTLVVQNATQSEYTKYGTVNAAAEMPFVRRAWLGATFSF